MAEFPGFGEHCSEASCRQLDFLPLKCDACHNTFCKEHLFYSKHACASAAGRDRQVPVCPLCSQPVPLRDSAEGVDQRVSMHIDADCPSERAKGHIYKNRCQKTACKKRELVPVICAECGKNFCLTHRHASDHDCEGRKAKAVSNSGLAALSRLASSASGKARAAARPAGRAAAAAEHSGAHPAHMTEEEALAAAIAASLGDDAAIAASLGDDAAKAAEQQEAADRELAERLQRTEFDAQDRRQDVTAGGRRHSDRCDIA